MKRYRITGILAVAGLALLMIGLASLPVAESQVVSTSPAPLQVQVFPPGAPSVSQQPFIANSTGTTGSIIATQPAQPNRTNYLTGFEIMSSGSTAAATVGVTLASGGTTMATYNYTTPALASSPGATPLIVEFSQPVAGFGPGQTMTLQLNALGAGTTNASVTIHGFSQ